MFEAGYRDWCGEAILCYLLGTEQIGRDMGIANRTGKPDAAGAATTARAAWDAGAQAVRTARGYGVSDRNTRSIHLFLKSGFIIEGCLRDSDLIDGRYHNGYLFGVLDSDRR